MRLSKALSACTREACNGVVYVIIERGAERGPCKIGYTTGSLGVRLSGLQTGNHRKLEVYVSIGCANPKRIERFVHKYFSEYRIAGEWFAVSADEAATVVRNAMVGWDN